MGANNQMPCDFCGAPYDPVSTRWLCPNCHMKTNCCDGAPCEIKDSQNYEPQKSPIKNNNFLLTCRQEPKS